MIRLIIKLLGHLLIELLLFQIIFTIPLMFVEAIIIYPFNNDKALSHIVSHIDFLEGIFDFVYELKITWKEIENNGNKNRP